MEKGDWILTGLAVTIFLAMSFSLEARMEWVAMLLLFVEGCVCGCLFLRFTSWLTEIQMVKHFGRWVSRMSE